MPDKPLSLGQMIAFAEQEIDMRQPPPWGWTDDKPPPGIEEEREILEAILVVLQQQRDRADEGWVEEVGMK